MTKSDQTAPKPVPFAGEMLERYRHVCAFIDSRDEEDRLLDPFVTDRIDRGEKLVYFIDGEERAHHIRHFQRLGLDMLRLLGQKRFEFRVRFDDPAGGPALER